MTTPNNPIDTIRDDLKQDADRAYCNALDLADKNCRGSQYKIENGLFKDDDLKWHCKHHEMIGFHRGIYHALAVLSTLEGGVPDGNTSDGYHTFNELYEHRHTLFIALLKCYPDKAWKSWKHDDGSQLDGWFIAGIETPDGQATYHLPARIWEDTVAECIHLAPKWDGHTSDDVLKRIATLRQPAADNPSIVDRMINEGQMTREEADSIGRVQAADNRGVDVESLKKKPEDFESHVPPNRQFMNLGWNDCINYLSTRGLLRTTPEDGKGDGWQPIETAPRDEVFCVWMPFGTMYTQCRWREDRGCAENHFGLLPEATHWTIPHGPTTQQPEHEGE